MYHFWLADCIEIFVRGCGSIGQTFIARGGLLKQTALKILNPPSTDDGILVSTFALLAELVRFNKSTLLLFENSLNDLEFKRFLSVIINNVSASNTFIASLFITLETISFRENFRELSPTLPLLQRDENNKSDDKFNNNIEENETKDAEGEVDNMLGCGEDYMTVDASLSKPKWKNKRRNYGYQSNTWVQFSPRPLSKRAIDIYESKEKYIEIARHYLNSAEMKQKDVEMKRKQIAVQESLLMDTIYNKKTENKLPLPPPSSKTEQTLAVSPSNNFSRLMDSLSDIRNVFKRKDVNDKSSGNEYNFRSNNDETDHGDDFKFFTPDEELKYSKGTCVTEPTIDTRKVGITNSTEDHYSIDKQPSVINSNDYIEVDGADKTPNKSSCTSGSTPSNGTANRSSTKSFKISENLFRLSLFVIQEKVTILLNLLSSVSLDTINPNMRSLNTALLILMFEWKR